MSDQPQLQLVLRLCTEKDFELLTMKIEELRKAVESMPSRCVEAAKHSYRKELEELQRSYEDRIHRLEEYVSKLRDDVKKYERMLLEFRDALINAFPELREEILKIYSEIVAKGLKV